MRFLIFLFLAPFAYAADVTEYGAIPNDGIDDREAIQSAIYAAAGGGTVFLPSGVYDLSQAPNEPWNLTLDGTHNVTIKGEAGTVLVQMPGAGGSTRMFSAYNAKNISFEALTLDGNKESQWPHPHRHGLFFGNSENLTVRNVEVQSFTGDGIYIYVAMRNVVIDNVDLHDNGRNGLTIGGYATGLVLTNSRLVNNASQQFDSEGDKGKQIDNVSIIGNTIISPYDYAIAAGGTGTQNLGKGWRIVGNHIESGGRGARLIWLDGAVFANNTVISGAGGFTGVQVYHRNKGVIVSGNSIMSPNYGENGGVSVIGTGDGVTDFVTISNNQIDVRGGATQTGIRVQGARNALITGNQIVSNYVGAEKISTIFVRATKDINSVLVTANMIVGKTYYGIKITDQPGSINKVTISGNVIMGSIVRIDCGVCGNE